MTSNDRPDSGPDAARPIFVSPTAPPPAPGDDSAAAREPAPAPPARPPRCRRWALPGTADPTPTGWTAVAPIAAAASAPVAGSTPAATRADRGRNGGIGMVLAAAVLSATLAAGGTVAAITQLVPGRRGRRPVARRGEDHERHDRPDRST